MDDTIASLIAGALIIIAAFVVTPILVNLYDQSAHKACLSQPWLDTRGSC
jgi:hypothetical protein